MTYSEAQIEKAKKMLSEGLPNESLFIVVNEQFQIKKTEDEKQKKTKSPEETNKI